MKILHLYPDLMNLYGESGNVLVLERHLKDQGLDVALERKTLGDEIDFSQYGFVYMGAGTERNQKMALGHLKQYQEGFLTAVQNGAVMLFTGNAGEVLGKTIHGTDATDYEGLALLPFTVKEDPVDRYTGDAVFSAEWSEHRFVGFVNRCSTSEGIPAENTLFQVRMGRGNTGQEKQEGFRIGNLFATSLTGPVLVKNPHFMEMIVALTGKRALPEFVLREVPYPAEQKAYQVTLKALEERMG